MGDKKPGMKTKDEVLDDIIHTAAIHAGVVVLDQLKHARGGVDQIIIAIVGSDRIAIENLCRSEYRDDPDIAKADAYLADALLRIHADRHGGSLRVLQTGASYLVEGKSVLPKIGETVWINRGCGCFDRQVVIWSCPECFYVQGGRSDLLRLDASSYDRQWRFGESHTPASG